MKILIVYGGGNIFGSLSYNLNNKLNKAHKTEIWNEKIDVSALKILRYRIRKFGFLRGISQFIYKLIDYYFLRNNLRKKIEKKLPDFKKRFCKGLNERRTLEMLKENDFDLIIAIATSILKEECLSIPKYGFINIHPGILPQYRGIGNFWALHNKDFRNIGCTMHWMTKDIDKGEIISKVFINPENKSIWDINYESMLKGTNEIAKAINEGSIHKPYQSENGIEKYYSWNGIFEYITYLRIRFFYKDGF